MISSRKFLSASLSEIGDKDIQIVWVPLKGWVLLEVVNRQPTFKSRAVWKAGTSRKGILMMDNEEQLSP